MEYRITCSDCGVEATITDIENHEYEDCKTPICCFACGSDGIEVEEEE